MLNRVTAVVYVLLQQSTHCS